jgi:hypothetical protein
MTPKQIVKRIEKLQTLEEGLISLWGVKRWIKDSPLIPLYDYLERYDGNFFLLITNQGYLLIPFQEDIPPTTYAYYLDTIEMLLKKGSSSLLLECQGIDIKTSDLCTLQEKIEDYTLSYTLGEVEQLLNTIFAT